MQVQHQYTIPNLTVGDGLLIYTTQTNYARDYQTFTLYQVSETDGTTATAHRISLTDKEPETIRVHLNNPKITITHPTTHTDVPVVHVGEQQKVADSPFWETFFITDQEEDNLTAVHVTHAFTTGVGYVSAPLEKLVVTDGATETILNYLKDVYELVGGVTTALYRDAITDDETYNAFPPVATEALQEFINYSGHDTIWKLLGEAHYAVTPEQWENPTVEYAWESIYNADERLVDSAQIDDITWWHNDTEMVTNTVRYLEGKLAALNMLGDISFTEQEKETVNEYTALLNRLIARLKESGLY